MTLRKKIVLAALAACSCLFMLCACGTKLNPEEEAKKKGATVEVILDLNGGVSSGKTERKLLVKPSAPLALPWEHSDLINPPDKSGYVLEGWYKGTTDEEGNVVFSEKWDFRDPVTEDMTLYAKWQQRFAYKIIDAVSGEHIKYVYCAAGATFDTSDSAAPTIQKKTFLNYYQDRERTTLWNKSFTHPGFPAGVTEENAKDEDYEVPVYAYYLEGSYKKVYTANDLVATSANYYLVGDENGEIDCSSLTNWMPKAKFTGKFIGNGVTIKNLVCNWKDLAAGDPAGVGLLFRNLQGGEISDVKFSGCTLNVTYTVSPKSSAVIGVGLLCGRAEGTAVKDVSFEQCAGNMKVAKNGGNEPVAHLAYEEAGGSAALWCDRESDGQNNNDTIRVSGEIAVVYQNEI